MNVLDATTTSPLPSFLLSPLLCVILMETISCFHPLECIDQKASNYISNEQYIPSEIFI